MIKAGGKNFKTKGTLQNYCKYVLNTATINTLLEGEWFRVVDDVLKMHECYDEKVGTGTYSIGVRRCSINPRNRQFYILREDGSDTDFSYRKALIHTSRLTHVKQLLRDAIKPQSSEYKDNYFAGNADRLGYIVCPETGLKVKKKDAHVDHYPVQFDEIVQSWAEKMGVDSETIAIHHPGDNATVWIMDDKALYQSFIDYHQEVATYRVVLNKVNAQRKKAARAKF